jgi:uncharacterized protein (TIGR01319 family)
MSHFILVDFGSTFTKVAVVSPENQEIIFTTKEPSTVKTDACLALESCLERVRQRIGNDQLLRASRLACSSAAGGLRMIVVGLTPSLSMLAGKNAALGAGSRVMNAYSYKLSDQDIKEIATVMPEIILLCGGIDGGNKYWPLENAKKIATNPLIQAPVVFAGNNDISSEVKRIFNSYDKECLTVKNILPDLGDLVADPAAEAIRNIFMRRIVNMKGLDKARQMVGEIIMPTPAAVLTAGKLLSTGTEEETGLGNILVFDVGGATTDVYSFCLAKTSASIKTVGAPEPFAKRTVEGDLGLRSSALSLAEAIGWQQLTAESKVAQPQLKRSVELRTEQEYYLAKSDEESLIDYCLTSGAIFLSSRRHAGRRMTAYFGGSQEMQKGKDLTGIELVIGTGGPIINSPRPVSILKAALRHPDETDLLLPSNAQYFIDRQYIIYATGLLSRVDPQNALAILKNNLEEAKDQEI